MTDGHRVGDRIARIVLADALALCWARFDDPDCLADDLARYLAVTPEDVQRVANTWLTDDRLILSVLSFREAALAVPDSAPVVPP